MLAIWRLHGVDKALKAAWEQGVVLAGLVGRGELLVRVVRHGLVRARPGPAEGRPEVPATGSFCPHYDSESLRRPRYEELVGAGALPDGFAADDGVGVLFEGRQFVEAVASLPGQHAYRVERRRGNAVEETQIRARLLRLGPPITAAGVRQEARRYRVTSRGPAPKCGSTSVSRLDPAVPLVEAAG